MLVFQDPYAISRPDRIVDGEERWQTIGLVRGINILVVAHTYPEHHGEDVIRIISARKAAPYERRLYEEGF